MPNTSAVADEHEGIHQTPETKDPETEENKSDREQRIRMCLADANELKQEGNTHFKSQEWQQALVKYNSGLGRLPKRPGKKRGSSSPAPGKDDLDFEPEKANEAGPSSGSTSEEQEDTKKSEPPRPLEGLDLECSKARSVLNSNIGACHLKMEEYKAAVDACTEALADDPGYIKAIQRRATCNEEIGSWSSLASAQDDYNTLLKLYPPNSSQTTLTRRTLDALKPRIEAAQKKETSEALDKLKGLGNSILGNFGLSTDNFKFEPNGQGGYSMNFVR